MAIEARSIDWVPETERHGRIWHQAPLWFLGNFQYFSIPIGFVGPALGLSMGWTILAGVLGILTGTVFMAFHAAQGPPLGLPQMIQSRAQFGYRGVIVPLFATAVHLPRVQRRRPGAAGRGPQRRLRLERRTSSRSSCTVRRRAARDLRPRLGAPDLPDPALHLVPADDDRDRWGSSSARPAAGSPTAAASSCVAFMAQFSAAAAYNITYAPYVSDYSRYLPRETTQPLDHRLRLLRRVAAGDLADRARRLAGHVAGRRRRPGRPDDGRQQRHRRPRRPGRVLLGRGAGGDDGHERLRRHADRADRASTPCKPINPTRRLRVVTILGLTVVWFVIAKSISASAVVDRLHVADADALPARAVDRDQPGRLLLRAPRPLRDHRPVQGRTGSTARWGAARPDRLRRRLPGRDPVHGPARPRRLVLHRASWPRRSTASTSPGSSA